MLRTSIASSRLLLSVPIRQRVGAQWLRPRYYAEIKNPDSKAADSDPAVRTPASPSSASTVHPESVPKPAPSHHTHTSPGSSVKAPEHKTSGVPPPPPTPPPAPARKSGRLRRFLLYLILTTGVAYAGGVWFSLKSDNFHDFFTEYVPYGEEAILYLEERDFSRRFPNATRQVNRRETAPRDEGKQVSIPSNSGLSWKVSEEQSAGSDVSQNGRHMSAVEAAKPQAAVVEKAKEDTKKKAEEDKPAPKTEQLVERTKTQPQVTLEEPMAPAVPAVTTIELLKVEGNEDPVVQDLVKIFNDMITVIGADESAPKFSTSVSKAKEELAKAGARIAALRDEYHNAALEEIRNAQTTFDTSAQELIRRIDEVRSEEAAQFREEFESEREKLAQSYQDKIKTEVQGVQEVSEQRLRNELVEQAIELNRKFLSDVRSLVENEREGRLSKLSDLSSNVAELEQLTASWTDVIDKNLKTQQLQVAIDSVRTVLENSDIPRPFIRELAAVKELASSDPVVNAAISSINPVSYQRGIPTSAQIVDRFRRVASEVRKASLLPENAGITSHAASYMMSKVKFKKQGSAVGDDVDSILTRTENLLEEGNFDDAAREMNGLQGWARMLSKDWLGDVRRVLEVKQALEIIETEARLQCLEVE
ncbi:hypothetical protein AJ80_01499 [Polytolypa hystricis UAMH7299]|uniref:MICOS complex subunit MIC60 n=1 Tax=Polytolypa hystricis (strain UAMH7299) TaxID=1447883 RepID=A0A2B7YZH1_POLH7|nr:hypothetical protein AJ80_01499 [Polytolypa hystricis UAMH7299]